MLGEPVVNFSQAVVDETIRANVDFQGEAGLNPKIYRKAERKCCQWCRDLAGEYDYPVDREVYRRHERCRCIVEYDPGDGRRQNAHTKKWTDAGDYDKLEERKRFSKNANGTQGKKSEVKKSADWDEAKGSSAWSKTKQKAMYSAEYGTVGKNTEVARLYDENGKRLLMKNGDVNSVTFSPSEIKQMRGGTLTHNHPSNGCFSPNDINILRRGKLQEIRAVTSEGVFRMQAPASWSREISSFDKIDRVYYEFDAKIGKAFYDRARVGEISFYEAEKLSQNAVIEELCNRYRIPFAFDSWDDIREVIK